MEKIDLWRLLIIYYEGGYYQDIDRLYNIPLNNIILNNNNINIKLFLPTFKNMNFAQDIMCSSPKNIIFKYSIQFNLLQRKLKYLNLIKQYNNNKINKSNINYWLNNSNYHEIMDLGPQTYFYGVTKASYGKIINLYLNKNLKKLDRQEIVIKMRKQIEKIPMIATYDEQVCDTIVYETNDFFKCKRISKYQLWRDSNKKKHWTSEVQH